MVGTWYKSIKTTYVYELPNPCNADDMLRAIEQLAIRTGDSTTEMNVTVNDESILIEAKGKTEKSRWDD